MQMAKATEAMADQQAQSRLHLAQRTDLSSKLGDYRRAEALRAAVCR